VKSWAIVVGINAYTGTQEAVLGGAVADAEDFADWALTTADVAPADLFFWTHPAGVAPGPALQSYLAAPSAWRQLALSQATGGAPGPVFTRPPMTDEVTETGVQIARLAAGEKITDPAPETKRCYVFFAGHGLQTNSTSSRFDLQTCFMLGDFRFDNLTVAGMIPCEDFRRALLAAGFDEVIIFLDCCRVPDPQRLRGSVELRAPAYSLPTRPVWAQGEAAQMGDRAYETTTPPIRGAFSKTLLQGLRTVRDPEGALSFDALKSFVCANIGAHTDQDQRPGFEARPNNPYPTILRPPPGPVPGAATGDPGGIVSGAPQAAVTVGPPEALVRIDLSGLPPGTPVRLVDGEAKGLGDFLAGPQPVEIMVRTGALYGLDAVTLGLNMGFDHPGPEVKDVVFR